MARFLQGQPSCTERESARQPEVSWRNDLLWVLERHPEAAERQGDSAVAIDRLSRAIDVLRPTTIDPARPDDPRLRHLETNLERLPTKE